MTRCRPFALAIALTVTMHTAAFSAAAGDAATATTDALRTSMRGLGDTDRDKVLEAIDALGRLDDPRAIPAIEALVDKRLRCDERGGLYIVSLDGDRLTDALTGEPASVDTESLSSPKINNRVRRSAKPVVAQLSLRAPDAAVRLSAAGNLRRQPTPAAADPIRKALQTEEDPRVREELEVALAQIDLDSEDRALRLAAIALIGRLGDRNLETKLASLLEVDDEGSFVEEDADIRAAAQHAIAGIQRITFFRDLAGNFFYGLSLASVLLLAALGLAITFGLMGVINMAHGEMLMIGAYTTYVVLGLFETYLPAWLDLYPLVALPAAFAVCALIGMALERSVIRFLYGRPLETLLATWGISLILIQTVRLIFGAQNVEVANPTWLSGGWEILRGVVLPWSRIAIVGFAASMVGAVWLLLRQTRLGLYVRAVTQNREMAAGLGIATARVDMLTFGLGSGIAGLGGVALSQIGNVGPELGQAYIVDSFMVVVLGGVGNILGSVVAAGGLGILNKFLEPISGAVLGKIFVLGFLILFIQRRPQGIFALQGRAAEN